MWPTTHALMQQWRRLFRSKSLHMRQGPRDQGMRISSSKQYCSRGGVPRCPAEMIPCKAGPTNEAIPHSRSKQ